MINQLKFTEQRKERETKLSFTDVYLCPNPESISIAARPLEF